MSHEPLVELVRGGLVEGVHHGSLVVLAPDGTTLFAAGDPDVPMYPRSTAKPLQATAMARLGLRLSPAGFAIAAASHSGERMHLDAVADVLGGRSPDALGNPADLPYDPVERDDWLAAGRTPSRVAHNCSGKHAAMLATCDLNGWDTGGYLDPAHPLQRAIAATVEDLTGHGIERVAVDGCGAPLFATTLRGLATAVSKIATAAPGTPEHLVADGVRRHPELVGGSRRDVTAVMRAVPGLLAKDGFEAVQVAALPDGTAIAVKIADGGDRARYPVLAAALKLVGVEVPPGPENLRFVGNLPVGSLR
ncbi:asparaginase [Amycolatopsis sp. FBCC-B4732]|uniref:asparaginase n=1 Tax=Amycolatopsis sp. FBCC-B4732 TaxID=3079339 RepID=UPI001FF5B807|nr:asparaginase [Amycolatopsis sp. FBCC-B4732]UOX85193.1 asparaginase [Amycolatopsis sp. FBCC-B4732]